MPKRVPRTEYSASEHWEHLSVVTGIPVTVASDATMKARAQQAFHQAGDFDFVWSTMVDATEFGNVRTTMGHAVHAAGGTDWNANVSAFFTDPEQVLAFDPMAALGTRDRKEITRRLRSCPATGGRRRQPAWARGGAACAASGCRESASTDRANNYGWAGWEWREADNRRGHYRSSSWRAMGFFPQSMALPAIE